jgi:hypothetical protein
MIAHNAARSHAFEQAEQLVLQEARQLCNALAAATSGEAVERMEVEWSRALGPRVLQAGPQARVEQVQGQAQRECACSGRRHVHSHRRRTVLTLLGPVQVARQYLRCEGCGAWSFPADEWLGWQHGFSRRLQEAVAWAGGGDALPRGAAWVAAVLWSGAVTGGGTPHRGALAHGATDDGGAARRTGQSGQALIPVAQSLPLRRCSGQALFTPSIAEGSLPKGAPASLARLFSVHRDFAAEPSARYGTIEGPVNHSLSEPRRPDPVFSARNSRRRGGPGVEC